MEMDVAKLDTLLIIAEKTSVAIRLDKKIYTIEKDLTVHGGSASDILDNVTYVSVDVEGNVALKRNNKVSIFIVADDREQSQPLILLPLRISNGENVRSI